MLSKYIIIISHLYYFRVKKKGDRNVKILSSPGLGLDHSLVVWFSFCISKEHLQETKEIMDQISILIFPAGIRITMLLPLIL